MHGDCNEVMYEVNQEESEQREVDGMKKGANNTLIPNNSNTLPEGVRSELDDSGRYNKSVLRKYLGPN